MNPNYLDFEQPIADLEVKIEELRLVGTDNEINISGTKFRVEGGGLNPNFPDQLPGGLVQYSPPGYPTPESRVVSVNGTVLPSIPGKRGGSYVESTMFAPAGQSGFNAGNNSIVILRVVLPVSS